jgi:hypothetical protein
MVVAHEDMGEIGQMIAAAKIFSMGISEGTSVGSTEPGRGFETHCKTVHWMPH